MGRVEGKVAIVTGAGSGMGRSHAIVLAREGAKILATDQNEAGLEETVAQIREAGGTAEMQRHDVADEANWNAVFETVTGTFGKLDILVNNAGVVTVGNTEDCTLEQWDSVFNVNARGTFIGVRGAVPLMKQNGGGSIINVSSTFALIGRAGFGIYCASKGAVRLLTKSVAAEVAEDQIRVNSIHPGLIETPMTEEMIDTQEKLDFILGSAPLRRAGTPEEVSALVLYLASDESRFVIGSEMVVDGGMAAI
ncbi:SDR family NAD(P)-dependent oxidoreductase [Microbulbifer sp. S227A]|uniref:SDR family NAD(P)-dependent oxidoreductase n=1 Tax=Microbulbifer sp. S227A TaxID=3415131 RepID=UPI003C7C18AA